MIDENKIIGALNAEIAWARDLIDQEKIKEFPDRTRMRKAGTRIDAFKEVIDGIQAGKYTK